MEAMGSVETLGSVKALGDHIGGLEAMGSQRAEADAMVGGGGIGGVWGTCLYAWHMQTADSPMIDGQGIAI